MSERDVIAELRALLKAAEIVGPCFQAGRHPDGSIRDAHLAREVRDSYNSAIAWCGNSDAGVAQARAALLAAAVNALPALFDRINALEAARAELQESVTSWREVARKAAAVIASRLSESQ